MVLLRALETRGVLDSVNGRIAVGWLVVEDLAMVLVLVLLPPLAGWLSGRGAAPDVDSLWKTLGMTLLQVGGFVALMLVVGRRFFPWVLWQVQRTGSRELFTLCVVAAAVGIAFGATALFGVSFALGAFFAGMVMRESEFSHRAAEESLPLRDAFAVLFFVSVGMLFDPWVIVERPLQVLAVVAIIVVGKSLAAAALVLAFRYPLNTALTVSASLAQIGEFSFILVAMGVSLGLLPPEGQSLVLAGALISIALNPLVFTAVEPLQQWILAQIRRWPASSRRATTRMAELPASTEEKYLSRQVVLVGYGRVGRRIADALAAQHLPFVVVEQNREVVERLRGRRPDGGVRRCGRAGGAGAGPYRQRPHAGDRHARHPERAADDQHRPHAQPRHRNRGAHPQRGRSQAAGKRKRRQDLPGRGRAGAVDDALCAGALGGASTLRTPRRRCGPGLTGGGVNHWLTNTGLTIIV